MIYKRYSLNFVFMDGREESFDCTDYRRVDGVYELYYSESDRLVMNFARPDFEIPARNVRWLFKEDIPQDRRKV